VKFSSSRNGELSDSVEPAAAIIFYINPVFQHRLHGQLHPSRVLLERCHDTCIRLNDQYSPSRVEPHSRTPPLLDCLSQCSSVIGMDRARTV
jgi:hypothetical protein